MDGCMIIMPGKPVRVPHHQELQTRGCKAGLTRLRLAGRLLPCRPMLHWQSTCCQEFFSTSPEEACGFCKRHHFTRIEELRVSYVDEGVGRIHQQRTLSQKWCPNIFLAIVV